MIGLFALLGLVIGGIYAVLATRWYATAIWLRRRTPRPAAAQRAE
jgi:hypothetical protein